MGQGHVANGMTTMAINVEDGILAVLREVGSSDGQIEDAKLVLGTVCEMKGHICILSATVATLESPKSIEWLQANKPHLLPRANQVADAELAFTGTGNKTAAARLIRELGRDEADRIAQMFGKSHALDNRRGVPCRFHSTGSSLPGDRNPMGHPEKPGRKILRKALSIEHNSQEITAIPNT